MIPFGFYVQSRFAGWFLMNHGGSPHPRDNDYLFQDLRGYDFQNGNQYEFQHGGTPSPKRLLQQIGFGILLESGSNILLNHYKPV